VNGIGARKPRKPDLTGLLDKPVLSHLDTGVEEPDQFSLARE
jgi:hypothetical protein